MSENSYKKNSIKLIYSKKSLIFKNIVKISYLILNERFHQHFSKN